MYNNKKIIDLEQSSCLNFLNDYYKKEDILNIYGISSNEISHSNFIAYLLNPTKEHNLGDFTIRCLLKSLLNGYPFSEEIKEILKSDSYSISDVDTQIKTNYIDILIKFKLNDKAINIVLENEVDSLLEDNQLRNYKGVINDKLDTSENVYLYLHPSYNDEVTKASQNGFYSITYQTLYEDVLLPILPKIIDTNYKVALENYIYSISKSKYKDSGLIITVEEKQAIDELISSYKDLLIDIFNNLDSNKEYLQFFMNHKTLFTILLNKIENKNFVSNVDEKLRIALKKAVEKKIYAFKGQSFKSVIIFIKAVFDYLISKGKTKEELEELINITGDNKLIVEFWEIINQKNSRFYKPFDNNDIVVKFVNQVPHFILSVWDTKDYLELRDKIQQLFPDLDMDNLDSDFKIKNNLFITRNGLGDVVKKTLNNTDMVNECLKEITGDIEKTPQEIKDIVGELPAKNITDEQAEKFIEVFIRHYPVFKDKLYRS